MARMNKANLHLFFFLLAYPAILPAQKAPATCALNRITPGMHLESVQGVLRGSRMDYYGTRQGVDIYRADTRACRAFLQFHEDGTKGKVLFKIVPIPDDSTYIAQKQYDPQSDGLEIAREQFILAYVQANFGMDHLDKPELTDLANMEWKAKQKSCPNGEVCPWKSERAKRAVELMRQDALGSMDSETPY